MISICFYSPPRSKSNPKLLDLLSTKISRLRTQYSGCGIIICGDRNGLKIEQLLSVDPALRQIVNLNTNMNDDKTLDVICTDLAASFQAPTRLPAIRVDERMEGVPSDHWGVEAKPSLGQTYSPARLGRTRKLLRCSQCQNPW